MFYITTQIVIGGFKKRAETEDPKRKKILTSPFQKFETIKPMYFYRKLKERIMDVLQVLEQNGGKDALAAIKSKIPTYTPIIC